MNPGHYTRNEIFSQPEAWSAGLEVMKGYQPSILGLQPTRDYAQILYTGCGSTYYLALAAAALTQELIGLSSRAFPASELWLYPRSSYGNRKTMLVAVSRSGETTETLRACEAFSGEKRGDLLTLSCRAILTSITNSPLIT